MVKPEPILTVDLTVSQFQYAWMIGQQRWERDLDKADEKKRSYKDSRMINLQGAIGEQAFAVMFGFDMDVSTEPRKGGVDFVADEISIDVKHTENTMDPKLRNPAYKLGHKYHADVYVLLAGVIDETVPTIGMIGWAFHGELMKKENIIKGSCTLPAAKLRRDLEAFRVLIGKK